MIKKILIWTGVLAGTGVLATGITLGAITFTKKWKSKDEILVDLAIEKIKNLKTSANQVLPTKIKKDDLSQYITRLDETIKMLKEIGVEVTTTKILPNPEKGELNLFYLFTSGKIKKEFKEIISGFIPVVPKPIETQKVFEETIKDSTFARPKKVEGISIKQDSEEKMKATIINQLAKRWSGTTKKIEIKKDRLGNYIVVLNQNTDTYVNNIFGKKWADIIAEKNNVDFKNIKQVTYGFKIEKLDVQIKIGEKISGYYLFPLYSQFSFEPKPEWLKDQVIFKVKITDNQNIISTFTIIE